MFAYYVLTSFQGHCIQNVDGPLNLWLKSLSILEPGPWWGVLARKGSAGVGLRASWTTSAILASRYATAERRKRPRPAGGPQVDNYISFAPVTDG